MRSPVGRRWTREDFAGDSRPLARRLLGTLLVRVLDDGTLLAGRIVETEAYRGVIDAASHAYRGRRTPRNEAMYARPGTAYVYFTYGMHYCMNVVCGELDVPHAVLLRALDPVAGLDAMRELRGVHPGKAARPPRIIPDRELCSGPARLCQAMGIDREQNGLDLVSGGTLFIAEPHARLQLAPVRPREIARTPRIGIDYAGAWAAKPLRFVLIGSPHASGRVPLRLGVKVGKPSAQQRAAKQA
jgi:DNA-3-methyladenine glycosylase